MKATRRRKEPEYVPLVLVTETRYEEEVLLAALCMYTKQAPTSKAALVASSLIGDMRCADTNHA